MKRKADISIVLDRSGSMMSCRDATIEGLNSFINEQRTNTVETVLSVYQFDDVYETVFAGKTIHEVVPFSHETFVPRGSTSLLDAIGKTIDDTGRRLAALPESERPDRVLVVIVTDGGENSSTTYSHADVFAKIRHQESRYAWNFIFLGANQDAISVGSNLGMKKGSSLKYDASTLVGNNKMWQTVSRSTKTLSECDAGQYEAVTCGCIDLYDQAVRDDMMTE